MQATGTKREGGQIQLEIDKYPDHCPACHHAIEPRDTGQHWLRDEEKWLEIVFWCPRRTCEKYFIAMYVNATPNIHPSKYKLDKAVPHTLTVPEFSDTIKTVSPEFVTIFTQAEEAEQRGLTLICGPGYRKCLECLIKDYVIQEHPDKTDEIRRLNLAKCIHDYVTDGRVKGVAERAVWLGNDETHYMRKWEDRDLQDLKRLISLTVHWIEMEELTSAAMRDMPEGRK